MLSNLCRGDEGRHQGKGMKVQEYEKQKLMPKCSHDQVTERNASHMTECDSSAMERLLTASDAPRRGKRVFGLISNVNHVNVFDKYGATPPPPAKPPSLTNFTESQLAGLMHDGHHKARQRDLEVLSKAPSLWNKNLQQKRVDRYFSGPPAVNSAESLLRAREYSARRHGLLDALLAKSEIGRREGVKMAAHDESCAVADPKDPTFQIPGFKGLGSYSPSVKNSSKHIPQVEGIYDPLHLKEKFPGPYSPTPRKKMMAVEPIPQTAFLMSQDPEKIAQVPAEPARSLKHFADKATTQRSDEVVKGFPGLGSTSPEVKNRGTKHLQPIPSMPAASLHRKEILAERIYVGGQQRAFSSLN